MRSWYLGLLLLSATLLGCSKSPENATSTTQSSAPTHVKLALNWKPEPEFGGFYAAQLNGDFKNHHHLDVDITGGGDQVAQMVAAGQVDFGILAADEVLTARAKGVDLVALFAVYQTNPQGIMTHAARGFTSLDDVFANPGTLAVQPGLAYVDFLKQKYPDAKVKLVPYDFSIVQFMADPAHSQQCFITSEPLAARRKGGDPKVFLIAESGFNPYATVVVARGQTLRNHPDRVHDFTAAVAAGWRAYLDNPKPANDVMSKLNPEMDPQTFAAAAEAQKPLIETPDTKAHGLGTMSTQRWETLAKQLADLKIIDKTPPAQDCFVNPNP